MHAFTLVHENGFRRHEMISFVWDNESLAFTTSAVICRKARVGASPLRLNACARNPGNQDSRKFDAQGRLEGRTRREVLLHAAITMTVPFVHALARPSEALAVVSGGLDVSEALTILEATKEGVDDLQAAAAFGKLNDLRVALRVEPFRRLRAAVAAVSTARPDSDDVKRAAKQVRATVERADLTALRASRGQAPTEDVPLRLEDLRQAIAALVQLVDADADGGGSG